MSPYYYYGPNCPGLAVAKRNASDARAREQANNPENKRLERAVKALAEYPAHAAKLGAMGLFPDPPPGYGESFELRRHLLNRLLADAEDRIADAMRPVERGVTPAARLALVEAEVAALRRPINVARGKAIRNAGRRSPPSRSDQRDVERELFFVNHGLAATREQAVRIVAAGRRMFS